MILNEDSSDVIYQIRAYGPDYVTVNEQSYQKSLIISPNTLITEWKPRSTLELTDQDFIPIIDLKPELLILGTGNQFKLLSAKQLSLLYQHKIKVECMTTGAACRTYVALSAEGRNLAAALIISAE